MVAREGPGSDGRTPCDLAEGYHRQFHTALSLSLSRKDPWVFGSRSDGYGGQYRDSDIRPVISNHKVTQRKTECLMTEGGPRTIIWYYGREYD